MSQMGRNTVADWRTAHTQHLARSGLEQREINGQYYSGVPAFLRSEGPFTVYNHYKMKGEEFHENQKLNKSNAKQRL